MIWEGQTRAIFKESNTRVWHEFVEPSGRKVYGLWNKSQGIFYTFLGETMFANRLRMEKGEREAYGHGKHLKGGEKVDLESIS